MESEGERQVSETECKEKMKEMQFKYERERFMYEMECENEMWKSQMKIAKRSVDEAIRSIESVPDPTRRRRNISDTLIESTRRGTSNERI